MCDLLSKYTGRVAVVTGGAGAIGSNLVGALLELGSKVVVFDDLSTGLLANLPSNPNLRFFRMDITDCSEVARVFARVRPDLVFNLAAHYANLHSIQEPRRNLEVNSLAVLALLECCQRYKTARFIQASSSCVYDHSADVPLREGTVCKASTPYGISKGVAEEYCWFFRNFYGLDVTVLRYFNSYGPLDYPGIYRGVVPNMIDTALKNQPLTITGTGRETRDFTYVSDIVAGTLLAGTSPLACGEVFNIGSGHETTIMKIAQIINRISRNDAGIDYRPKRPWDLVERRVASIDKARELLGYHPTVELEEGLRRTYQWYIKFSNEVETSEDLIYK